jgi:serine/threonine protein phosphatase PrpC
MLNMEWEIATQTHCGNVRPINEDTLLAEKQYPLLMVADGMGGHEAGEVASGMLAKKLAGLYLSHGLHDAVAQVKRAILQCNDEMVDYARRRLGGNSIGSTVVVMLAEGLNGACLWAGDSRLYRVRDGLLQQLTADHSYVADMVRAGQLSAEEAINHPSSNVITRAVGASSNLTLDSEAFVIRPGDSYLLCTDGLYNEAGAGEILSAMLATDIWQSSDQLLRLCLGRKARDNISFILGRPVGSGHDDLDATLTYYPQSQV